MFTIFKSFSYIINYRRYPNLIYALLMHVRDYIKDIFAQDFGRFGYLGSFAQLLEALRRTSLVSLLILRDFSITLGDF